MARLGILPALIIRARARAGEISKKLCALRGSSAVYVLGAKSLKTTGGDALRGPAVPPGLWCHLLRLDGAAGKGL